MSVESKIVKAFHEAIDEWEKKCNKEYEKRFPQRHFRQWQNPFVVLGWRLFWQGVSEPKRKIIATFHFDHAEICDCEYCRRHPRK